MDIYNIHTDAGRKGGDKRARRTQFRQLAQHINQHSDGRPVIVAGDWNLKWADKDDRQITNDLFNSCDLQLAELNPETVTTMITQFHGVTLPKPIKVTQTNPEPYGVDYIAYRSGESFTLTKQEAYLMKKQYSDNGNELSDHRAVMGKFKYAITPLTNAPVAAEMLEPEPGSQLYGVSATFTWTPGSGLKKYYLNIKRNTGFNWRNTNVLFSGAFDVGVTQCTVPKLTLSPLGNTITVNLVSETLMGELITKSYQYTLCPPASPKPAEMESPQNGTTLPSSAVTFRWNAGVAVTSYRLTVGVSPSDSTFADQTTSSTTWTVTNLPTKGEKIYATLW